MMTFLFVLRSPLPASERPAVFFFSSFCVVGDPFQFPVVGAFEGFHFFFWEGNATEGLTQLSRCPQRECQTENTVSVNK